MNLKVYTADGSAHSEKEFAVPTFEGDKGLQTLKDLLVTYHANKRQGTSKTKTRAEVAGSGKKLFRQKGTGRGRKGDGQSPSFVGGGIAHGPVPQDWSKDFNKKAKRLAFARALFDKASEGKIQIIEKFETPEIKTRAFGEVIDRISPEAKNVLISDQQFDNNTALSARNLERVSLLESSFVNAWDIVRYQSIVITEKAFEQLLARATK